MHELNVAGEVFLTALPPTAPDSDLEAAATRAVAAAGVEKPALLYWDARIAGALDSRIRFGRGGLDSILAGARDLSSCTAISQAVYRRLTRRGSVGEPEGLARAVALLARAPGLSAVWCEGLEGTIDLRVPGPFATGLGPAAHADLISVVLVIDGPDHNVEPFFAALKGQAIQAKVDLVALAIGFGSQQARDLARQIDTFGAADPRLDIRRYSLAGQFSPAYAANLGVALANSEAVVIADVRCSPITPNAVQLLADWVIGGDCVAACPKIIHNDRLVAAGLALASRNGEEVAVLWNDLAFANEFRTAAAPAPWFFAVRRTAWVAADGVRGVADPGLWSAELAAAYAPKGRTLLVGSETAEWFGPGPPAPPDAATVVHRRLQSTATAALREPRWSNQPIPVTLRAGASRPGDPSASSAQAGGPLETHAFSDPFGGSIGMRILVFADAYGPSQTIAFIEGLAELRSSGVAAVRVVDENALGGDGRTLDLAPASETVEQQMREVRPDVVVVSRLGNAAAWSAIRAAAKSAGVPIVFHIDDDLLDPPVSLGIERYRLARSPKRLQTLRHGLTEADLVLTTTAALAQRLQPLVGRDRIHALSVGCAGRPPQHRPPRSQGSRLVIGYMGSASHDEDLAMVVPALNAISAAYDHVDITLFGSVADQPAARRLEGRITRVPRVEGGYMAFRQRLAELAWDVGLAPLRETAFNRVKTPTKWAEYAEAGIPVLASPLDPYLSMIGKGAAFAVESHRWEAALSRAVEDADLRFELTRRADDLLLAEFGWDRLQREVSTALELARTRPVAA